MIRPQGAAALVAAAGGFLLALLTLNYVLVVAALSLFTFLAAEVVGFHVEARRHPAGPFDVEYLEEIPRLPVGSETVVVVRATFRGTRPMWAELHDARPESAVLQEGSPGTARWFRPGDTVELRYRVRPTERGRYEFGPTRIIRHGALGLCFQEVAVGPTRPLLVTASNPSLRSTPAGFALYTRVRGRLALRHRGFGSEFRSLRAYELSDDIRHVAWRRSTPENLYVREFEQESRQDYLLVYDVSPPMRVGLPGTSGLDRAAEAGAVVTGFVERSAEDRVGLLTYADGVHQFLRPGRGAAHFRRVTDNLAMLRSRPGRFDLAELLEQLIPRLRVHTHVLLFSALAEPLADLHSSHRRFVGRGHHLYLFAAQAAGFYPLPADADDRAIQEWAQRVAEERLDGRIALLNAEGIPTYRFDRRGATAKVVTAYGQIRAWGRVG